MASRNGKRLPPYEHHGLDTSKQQIRLLRISRVRGAIHCDVSVHDINAAPAYRALSYTWGAPEPAYNIVIEGRYLAVRENLYAYLLKAGKGETGRQLVTTPYLWIDQISIDQNNVSERNHQVRLMAEIYQRAAVVTMWLGQTAGPECASTLTSWEDQKSLWTPEVVAELLRDPYFTRLWIVQEVLLNVNIEVQIRGNAQLGFDTLVSARYFWRSKLRQLGVSQNTLDLLIRYYKSGSRFGELKQLHYLLSMFSKNECADLRDKVYGLVGMCNETTNIVVDYSKTTQEVFMDVVMVLWTGYWKTRRASWKVRESTDRYYSVLLSLCKEMILEQHQQEAVQTMLRHVWDTTTGRSRYNVFHDERQFAEVTGIGFDPGIIVVQTEATTEGNLRPVPDQWWYTVRYKQKPPPGCYKQEKYIFECTATNGNFRRAPRVIAMSSRRRKSFSPGLLY